MPFVVTKQISRNNVPENLIIRNYEIKVKASITSNYNTLEETVTDIVQFENPLNAVNEAESTVGVHNSTAGSLNNDNTTNTVAIHYTSTVIKTCIREQWTVNELLSNTLTFGTSPIGPHIYVKIILSLLSILGLLILILFCYYKIFILYCYQPRVVIDYV